MTAERQDIGVIPAEVVEEWKLDDAARARAAAELARINEAQAGRPTCTLCGQRVVKLDLYRLCSKVDRMHREHREGMK